MSKKAKPIPALDRPTIHFERGLFLVDYGDTIRAYPPDIFIATVAAGVAAIREMQGRNCAGSAAVVAFKGKRGH